MSKRRTSTTSSTGPTSAPLRILKRAEVAELYGISPTRVDQLARAGILRKVKLPGLSRALGLVEVEVRELLVKRQVVM